MRIGILTFHCAHNYGAVLQCYALQEFLRGRGHDVYVIDYRPTTITRVYRWFKKEEIVRKNMFKAFREILLLKGKKARFDNFEKFINVNLRLASIESIIENPYDLILIGSDQVWNYNLTKGFDDFYWGNFRHPKQTRIASYAASMQDSWPEDMSNQIISRLKNFDSISVREKTLETKMRAISGRNDILTVVDPTLLMSSDFWYKIAKPPAIKCPYLLLYQVEGSNKKVEEIAIKIANNKGLKIVNLFTFAKTGTSKEVVSCSPEVFLGLFAYSDYVVCSSFHGTIFSIHFKKPFLSVRMGKGKDNRVASLLENLGMQDRFIDVYSSNLLEKYTFKSCKMDEYINESILFLKNLEK